MNRPFKPVLTVVVIETSIVLSLGFLLCVLDKGIGMSTLVGGMIFVIPNIYFTFYAFRYSGAEWAPWVLRSFYRGQAGKLVLVAVGFAMAFKLVNPLNPLALFGTFVFMNFVHILVAAKISTSRQCLDGETK